MIKGIAASRKVFIADGIELLPDDSQRVCNHSPDGFAWGYCGSGPAQLALALLMIFLPQECALKHYQDFKREFVALLSMDEDFEISPDDIRKWIVHHLQMAIA